MYFRPVLLVALLCTFLTVDVKANHGPRIQIVHNSASDSLANVDLWYTFGAYNGFAFRLRSNFSYGDATEYIRFTKIYGPINIFITEPNSIDTTILFQTQLYSQVDYYETYTLVLTGEPGNNLSFDLSNGLDSIAGFPGGTSVKVFHGSVGTPEFDIYSTSSPAIPLITGLDYGESEDYISLPAQDFVWRFKTTNGSTLAEFPIPLSFLADSSLSIHLSGYPDTTGAIPNNSLRLLFVSRGGLTGFVDPISISTSLSDQSASKRSVNIYPNPTNGPVTIEFTSNEPVELRADIYDLRGAVVRSISQLIIPGTLQTIDLDLADLEAGTYMVRLIAGEMSETRRILLMD